MVQGRVRWESRTQVEMSNGKRWARVVWIASAWVLLNWCGCTSDARSGSGQASTPPPSASGAVGFSALEHARNLLRAGTGFTSRAQVVSLADRLALDAEGWPKSEALEAARVVGDLRRRSYRTFHVPADGREAVVQYDRVVHSGDREASCNARIAAIVLRSELEDDPDSGYAGLYEASRRGTTNGCEVALRRALQDLEAYRLDSARLDAIDRKLADRDARPDGGVRGEQVVKPGASMKPGPAKIVSIETFSARDAARVVITLSGPVTYDIGTIAGDGGQGPRLYVDLHRTKRGKAPHRRRATGLVERVRVGAHKDKTRVVLDLSQRAYRRVFYLPEPFRIVMDISTTPPPATASKAAPSGQRWVRRVVLDPGHGGQDPGATGPGGLREKEVTLDIAHRVAPVLSREMGIVTMLTRDDDRYVPLEERAARANAFHADLFVSIHCNAAEDPGHRGVQTFVLAKAADEQAQRLAAKENATSAAAGHQVSAILPEVQVESVSQQSGHFATLLQRSTISSLSVRYGDVPDGGVRSAAFFVLLGAQMPAVLFEASFISNPREETRLATADYRQKLADGIANAIRAYREGR